MSNASPTQVLRGRIRDYRVSRTTEDEFLADIDVKTVSDEATGLTAILSSLAGHGGLAAGAMLQATDKEEADLVEFTLDGGERVKGFVWESPFKEGDEVEVVAERSGETWKAFGITRPTDRTIALHPHCSRGRKAHWKAVFSYWWKICFVAVLVLATFLYFQVDEPSHWINVFLIGTLGGGGLVALIFAGIAWSAGRQFMPFVRLAEAVFRRLGWRDVETIDLYKLSKRNRKKGDPLHLGVYYHRY